MAVIDEEGRVFGVVNVIDLLVVLVVLAVVAAGVALLVGGGAQNGDDETAQTRYATLSITSDVSNRSIHLAANDTLRPVAGGSNLTVTDTYVAPTSGGTRVVARVRYEGSMPIVDGATTSIGQTIDVQEGDLRTKALLVAANETGASLPVDTTAVAVEADLSPSVLDAVRAGDELVVAGHRVTAIESVTVYPRPGATASTVVVGARIRTVELDGVPAYGTQPIRVGHRLRLWADDTTFRGRIVSHGRTQPPGEPVETMLNVTLRNVSPTVADQFSVGMAERHRGATTTVAAVESEPATVTVTTDDGRVVEATHPRNRDVTLTLNATARRVNGELRFHGHPLGVGDRIALDFARIDVRGTVVEYRTT